MYPLAKFVHRPGWSGFDDPRAAGTHRAYDYYAPEGTAVRAPAGGVVTKIAYNGDTNLGYGHNITIDFGGGLIGTYAHLKDRPLPALWSTVTAGQVIGYVGRTGNAIYVEWWTLWLGVVTLLLHCHEALELNGVRIDPIAHWRVSTAGEGTDFDNESEDDMSDMKVIKDLNGDAAGYLSAPGRRMVKLPNVNDRALMKRYVKELPSDDGVLPAGVFTLPQIKIIEAYNLAWAVPVLDAATVKALLEGAIAMAFESLDIPTPSLSDEDMRAIIEGAGRSAEQFLQDDIAAAIEAPLDRLKEAL